jgi:hypothetical protein
VKVCSRCGAEIATRDGENLCLACQCGAPKETRVSKKEREQALRDCGLTKVKGALGGTYWE